MTDQPKVCPTCSGAYTEGPACRNKACPEYLKYNPSAAFHDAPESTEGDDAPEDTSRVLTGDMNEPDTPTSEPQWDGLNSEQRDHVQALNRTPRDERCASGWHVTADGPCKCDDTSASEPLPDTIRWDSCGDDVDDDCKAEFGPFMLRCEMLGDRQCWWAVYRDHEEVTSSIATGMKDARTQCAQAAARQWHDTVPETGAASEEQWGHARLLVEAQARDDGLWFVATTAPEAYLQDRLRCLHAAVEEDCKVMISRAKSDAQVAEAVDALVKHLRQQAKDLYAAELIHDAEVIRTAVRAAIRAGKVE